MTEVTPERVRLKLSQLGLVLSLEINYQLETMFPKLDGIWINREIRKKFQLIKEIEPLLPKLLLENEQVLFITQGKIEYHNTIVVLTNLRMLCMHTNGNGVSYQPFWFLYYTQVVDLKKIDSFLPRVKLKDGEKLSFQGFQDKDRETICSVSLKAFELLEDKGIDPPVSQSRENLCGNCFEVVAKHEYECDTCGATFWEPFEVGIRSLMIPSWGDFAMKNSSMARVKLISILSIWSGIAIALANREFLYAVIAFVTTSLGDAMMTFNSAAKNRYLNQLPEIVTFKEKTLN